MKKKLLLTIIMSMMIGLIGCGNTKDSDKNRESRVDNIIDIIEDIPDNEVKGTEDVLEEDADTEEIAEDSSAEEEVVAVDLSGISVGSIITFGTKDESPIEWQVLAIEDGKALIITKNCIFKRSYSGKNDIVTWETCSLREFLNGEFFDTSFNKAEKAIIVTTTNINDDNPKYGTVGGNDTEDAIFLLSIEEAKQYFADDDSRVAFFGDEEYDWWLRSPGYDEKRAACVYYDGYVNPGGGTFVDGNGVRPVCWVSIN